MMRARVKNLPGTAKVDKYRRRHSEIIDAAAAVFAEKGYHGASTKDIADRLGIRQGSLYYYFPSKEAALEEVCRIGVEGYIQRLRTVSALDVDPAEKLRRAIFSHLEPLRDRRNYVRVFLSSRHDLPKAIRHSIGRLTRDYETLFEEIVRAGVTRGDFRRNVDCRLASFGIIGMCNAVTAWYGVEQEPSLEKIAGEFAEMILAGLYQ